eukprot:GHVL01034184.1.p1 GENE.GHVL01034184.1~~GHVL01034184.1.p1  ORF type:complete len:721 (+),score=81.44 GHVL01034184.1:55-2217(+)
MEDVHSAILSLYRDQIDPCEQEIRRRLEEIHAPAQTIQNFLEICSKTPHFYNVVSESRTVRVFLKERPPWFASFIDFSDPAIHYPRALIIALIWHVSEAARKGVSSFKGGRYGMAAYIQQDGPEALRRRPLGVLIHMVQLLINSGFVSYESSTLKMLSVCRSACKSYLFTTYPVLDLVSRNSSVIHTVEKARKAVQILLERNISGLQLAQVKKRISHEQGLVLRQSVFRISKLAELLTQFCGDFVVIVRQGRRLMVLPRKHYNTEVHGQEVDFFGMDAVEERKDSQSQLLCCYGVPPSGQAISYLWWNSALTIKHKDINLDASWPHKLQNDASDDRSYFINPVICPSYHRSSDDEEEDSLMEDVIKGIFVKFCGKYDETKDSDYSGSDCDSKSLTAEEEYTVCQSAVASLRPSLPDCCCQFRKRLNTNICMFAIPIPRKSQNHNENDVEGSYGFHSPRNNSEDSQILVNNRDSHHMKQETEWIKNTDDNDNPQFEFECRKSPLSDNRSCALANLNQFNHLSRLPASSQYCGSSCLFGAKSILSTFKNNSNPLKFSTKCDCQMLNHCSNRNKEEQLAKPSHISKAFVSKRCLTEQTTSTMLCRHSAISIRNDGAHRTVELNDSRLRGFAEIERCRTNRLMNSSECKPRRLAESSLWMTCWRPASGFDEMSWLKGSNRYKKHFTDKLSSFEEVTDSGSSHQSTDTTVSLTFGRYSNMVNFEQ